MKNRYVSVNTTQLWTFSMWVFFFYVFILSYHVVCLTVSIGGDFQSFFLVIYGYCVCIMFSTLDAFRPRPWHFITTTHPTRQTKGITGVGFSELWVSTRLSLTGTGRRFISLTTTSVGPSTYFVFPRVRIDRGIFLVLDVVTFFLLVLIRWPLPHGFPR